MGEGFCGYFCGLFFTNLPLKNVKRRIVVVGVARASQLALVSSWLVSKLSISEPGCGGNLWQRRERGERGTKNGGCQLLFYYTVYQYATCLRVNVATTQNLFECPALQMTCHCRDSTDFLFFVFKRLCRRFPKFSRKNFKKETPFRFIGQKKMTQISKIANYLHFTLFLDLSYQPCFTTFNNLFPLCICLPILHPFTLSF